MKKYFQAPWNLKDVFNITITIIVAFILIVSFLNFINFEELTNNDKYKSYFISLGILLQGIIAILIIYFFSKKKYKQISFKDFGFKKIRFFKCILAILSAYFIYLGITAIIGIISFYLDIQIPGYEVQENILPFFGESNLDLIMAGVAIILIAPITEEILFRGFFLRALSNKWGVFYGSIISALIFSLLHYPWQSFIPIFILGLIINSLVIRYKTIWPAIGFHMFNNSLVFIFQLLILKEIISLDKFI